MIAVNGKQAEAAAAQAKLTTEQLKQDHELANMDLIMRLYEFANTAEVQASWLTIVNAKLRTYDDFLELGRSEQVAFYQIGALFESLGVLAERGIVKTDVIEDMFLTELAWNSMKPFIDGVRKRFGEEENYVAFEKLYTHVTKKP